MSRLHQHKKGTAFPDDEESPFTDDDYRAIDRYRVEDGEMTEDEYEELWFHEATK